MQQGMPFGAYVLLGELGSGGTGVVYHAWHRELERHCALKMLHARAGTDESRSRFAREAKANAKLGKHPNIVQIFDAGVVGDVPYMAMEIIKGDPLSRLLTEGGKLGEKDALELGRKVALAMDHAHARGIVHRDIKPGNIILDHLEEPQILDFGLAKDLDDLDAATLPGVIAGTPAYLSPEQAEPSYGEVDHRSDIYSLGATLYTTLTAELPYKANSVLEMLVKVLSSKPPNLGDRGINPDLGAVVAKAMEKRPEDRYQSALELADDLSRVLSGEVPKARRLTRRARILRWMRRRPFTVSFMGLAIFAAFALAGWFSFQRSEADVLWHNLSAQIAGATVDEATNLLGPAIPLLNEMKSFAAQDILPVTDFDALAKHLVMRFEPRQQLDWISYGRQDGAFIGVKRDRERKLLIRRNTKQRVFDYRVVGDDYTLKKFRDEPDTYDPRERPWYKLAAGQQEPVWTQPYQWHAAEGLGITATVADRRRDGSLRGAFTVDFRLHSLSQFLAKLDLGEGGRAYLLRPTPSEDPTQASPVLAGPGIDGNPVTPPLVAAAIAASPVPLAALPPGQAESFRFLVGEEPYLGALEAFDLPGTMRWVTLIAVPESTLGLSSTPVVVALTFGGVLILLAIIALFVSRARHRTATMQQATQSQAAFEKALAELTSQAAAAAKLEPASPLTETLPPHAKG